jgi:hypothetical protein
MTKRLRQGTEAPQQGEFDSHYARTRARGGRPSSFTPERAERICDWIAEGGSLRSYCRTEGAPAMTTIHGWLDRHEAFRAMYDQARDMQADAFFDEIIDIADTASDLDRARLQIDARKWLASRMAPRKYGNRIAIVLGTSRTQDHANQERR